MKQFAFVAAVVTTFGLNAEAGAGQLLDGVNMFMDDKPARVTEIRSLCRALLEANKGGNDQKSLILNVCAFDIGHTTGFNAVTKDNGKIVDLSKVQTASYTLGMMGSIQTEIKTCRRQTGFGQQGNAQPLSNDVAYCVAMRGYEYGKKYGQKYLKGQPME